jgi:tetratricopeptide (TPR) repeat protein
MKRFWNLALVVALSLPLAAQRTKIEIDAETPEGQLLQQIGTSEDPAEKLKLLESFADKYPNHNGLPWVYGQLQVFYVKDGQHDKVFPVVEKLLEIDPADAEMAHGALKAAEAKKDPDLIMKWATVTSEAAKKAVKLPKPEDEEEAEAWKYKVDFATQVDTYTEYSIFSTALQTADPAKKLELIAKLAERNPKSQYLPQLVEPKFLAYRQLNDNEKAMGMIDEMIAKNPNNEDYLLFAIDQTFQKKDYDKTLDYAPKAIELLKTKNAPEGMPAADWEGKKKQALGATLWMQGMIESSQSKFVAADKTLREALPYLEGNDQLMASALFNLGLANYKLGSGKTTNTQRILDALKFNQQCAAIKSQFQGQALSNIKAIRSQYRIQ